MSRKKKLRFIQVLLLITGITAIYLTYYNNENIVEEKIVNSQVKENFSKQVVPNSLVIYPEAELLLNLWEWDYLLLSVRANHQANV